MSDLQVVYPKPWMAEDFRKAGCTVTHELGIDVVQQAGPCWWATEQAARSIQAGHPTYLTAPNWQDFLDLGPNRLRRSVWAATMGTLTEISGLTAFVKPADSKIVGPGDVGKAIVARVDLWAEDCMVALDVPSTTPVLVSDPVEWTEEWRCWTNGHEILEASLYQRDGQTWNEWPWEKFPDDLYLLAYNTAGKLKQPCTIDVGYIDSQPAVVELNPIWSSGPYTSDLSAVYLGIKASYDFALAGKGRKWYPDSWLQYKSRPNYRKPTT